MRSRLPVLIGQQQGAFVAGAEIQRIAREGGVSELEGLPRAAQFAQQQNLQMNRLLVVRVAREGLFGKVQGLQQRGSRARCPQRAGSGVRGPLQSGALETACPIFKAASWASWKKAQSCQAAFQVLPCKKRRSLLLAGPDRRHTPR